MTRGLLGLTVACARCHDHKFDPIPTDDYYSLYGVFASSEEPKELPLLRVPGGAKEAKDFEAKLAERKKAVETFLAEKKARDPEGAADAVRRLPRRGRGGRLQRPVAEVRRGRRRRRSSGPRSSAA